MFKNLEPLDHTKHQDLRLTKIQSFNFARLYTSIKLSFSELRLAARYYPIIFNEAGGNLPQALMSLEGDTNLYIDENNQWKVPYVPIFFRQYPFTLAKVEDKEDQYAMCLDPDAPHFSAGQGDPLFTADGKPTEFLEKVSAGLQAYQKELMTTEEIFKKLADKELIVPRTLNFQVGNTPKSIQGFSAVDPEKLMEMDDAFLADLVRTGAMSFIHEHLNSINNMTLLVGSQPETPPGKVS